VGSPEEQIGIGISTGNSNKSKYFCMLTANLLHTGPADAEDELAGPWSWTPGTACLPPKLVSTPFFVEIRGIQTSEIQYKLLTLFYTQIYTCIVTIS
jgi:hypothetical protein